MDGIIDSMDMSLSKLREIVKNREAWRAAVLGIAELDMTEQRNNKLEYILKCYVIHHFNMHFLLYVAC